MKVEQLFENDNKIHAVIIKGNPKLINEPHAKKYYNDIKRFLKQNGVHKVTFDSGKAHTTPDKEADFYIGHSRGVDRIDYLDKERKKRALRFGVPEGYIHPVDKKWQEGGFKGGVPPKEHFEFTNEQQNAILQMIRYVKRFKGNK